MKCQDSLNIFTEFDFESCLSFDSISEKIDSKDFKTPQEFFDEITSTFDFVIRKNKDNKEIFSEALKIKKTFVKEFKTRKIIINKQK